MGKKLTVNDASFDRALAKYEKAALIEFFAPWCPHCMRMEPVMDKLAGEFEGKAGILAVNVDDSPLASRRYGVSGIPAFVFIKNGKVQDSVSGEMPEEELKKRISALLA